MKRRLLSVILAATMTVSMVACGNSSGSGVDSTESAGAEIQSVGGSVTGGDTDGSSVDVTDSVQHTKLTMDADRLSVNPMGLWQSATEVYSMYEMLFQTEDGLGTEMVPIIADGSRGEYNGYDHEDGSNEYYFYIQDDVYDHAGNHLTASDVVFSFEKTQEYGQTSGWSVVESWEAIDDTTVLMTCERELSNKGELENIVLRCFMFTEQAYNDSPTQFASDACGTGPYKLVSYTDGSSVVMEKNEDYWQTDESEKQRSQYANVDEIEVVQITEATQKVTGLTTGTTDLCQAVPADYVEQFTSGGDYGDDYTIVAAPANNVVYLEANADSASICSNVDMRKAIFYAVGSEEMCQGLGTIANYPVDVLGTDVFPDYNEEWASWDNYQTSAADVEKAQEYLEKAGYNGEEIVILCESGGSDTSVLVQSLLTAAGINSTIKALERNSLNATSSDPEEWDIYINNTRSSDYIANIWSHVLNADAFPSGMTEGFYDSEEYQDLLKAALSVDATVEDMDAFWQETIDQALIEGINCSISYIAYDGDDIASVWMNDKSVLLPGAFVYTN